VDVRHDRNVGADQLARAQAGRGLDRALGQHGVRLERPQLPRDVAEERDAPEDAVLRQLEREARVVAAPPTGEDAQVELVREGVPLARHRPFERQGVAGAGDEEDARLHSRESTSSRIRRA
jgi:hypothetical protein